MPDRDEVKLPTPGIVIEATDAIKKDGKFEKGLSANEVSGLIKGIVGELVTSNPQVKGNIPFMDVKIASGQADIKGTIRIDSPLGATVGVEIKLKNNERKNNSIALGGLHIDPKADSFIGKMALKALDMEGKAREVLSDPNQALSSYLTAEMKSQGVKLEGIGMKFTPDDKFTVSLRGKKI